MTGVLTVGLGLDFSFNTAIMLSLAQCQYCSTVMAHGECSLIEIDDVLLEFGCIFEVRQDRICSFASYTCLSQTILRRGVEVDSTTIQYLSIRSDIVLESTAVTAPPIPTKKLQQLNAHSENQYATLAY